MISHGPAMLFFGGIQILFWFVVAGGVALLIVWAISSTRHTHPAGPTAGGPAPQRETPLDILARRFASGDITAEEYERGRDLLGGGGKPS